MCGERCNVNEAIMQECNDECLKAYMKRAKLTKAPVGFDPTIIITIILALLDGCKRPASELKAAAKSPTWQAQTMASFHTRRVLRERYGWGGYAKYNGDAIVDAIFDAGKSATEEKIAQMCDCCG